MWYYRQKLRNSQAYSIWIFWGLLLKKLGVGKIGECNKKDRECDHSKIADR